MSGDEFILRKKLIISTCIILILVVAVAGWWQDHAYRMAIKPVEIADIPVSYQLLDTQFYYNQLTAEEKKIYEEIKKILEQYKSGVILLEQPISAKSYFQIESPLRYDYNNYWYLAYLIPFSKENKRIVPALEQHSEETMIDKLILIIDSKQFQERTYPLSEEDIITNEEIANKGYDLGFHQTYNDFKECFVDGNPAYYDDVTMQIESSLQQIIADMPEGLNQEKAVQYFSQWLVDHMEYDPIIANRIITGSLVGYDFRREISAGSISSIIDKNGTCTGFSLILTTLCNRIGIDAYIILGEVPNARHGWVAIKIGDDTYYKDPTSEIANKKVQPLTTDVQFYQYFHREFKPFSDLFEY